MSPRDPEADFDANTADKPQRSDAGPHAGPAGARAPDEARSAIERRLRARVVELERARDELTDLVNSTQIATLLVDTRLTLRRFTPAVSRLLHVAETDIGRPLGALSPRFTDDALVDDVRRVLEQPRPVEKQVLTDDGAVFMRRVLPCRTSEGRVDGVVITFSDVTDHVRGEHELRRVNAQLETLVGTRTRALETTGAELRSTERRFEFLVEAVPELFAYVDTQQRYRFVNLRHETVMGLPRSALEGRRLDEVLSPEAYVCIRPHVEKALQGEETRYEIELPLELGPRWLRVTLSPARDESGRTNGFFALATDITELKQAEARLRASRDDVEAVLAAAADGVIVVDRRGRIDIFNPAAESLFGYRAAEVLGGSVKLLSAEAFQEDDDLVERLVDSGLPGLLGGPREFMGRRRDGTTFPAELYVGVVAGGRRFIGVVRDVSERRRAEEELRHGREALRALASQLLHAQESERRRVARELHDDVNQRLGMLAVELESMLAAAAPPLVARLDALRERVVHLSDDVHRLAYRLHVPLLDDLGLCVAVEQAVQEFAQLHQVRAVFRARGPQEYPPGVADGLYRILQECLSNVTRHAPGAPIDVRLMSCRAAWRLSVRDFGAGFDVADVRRHRRGLGLVSIEERARALGGVASIHARPGWGTRARVTIPQDDPARP